MELNCSVCRFSFDSSLFLLTHLQNLQEEEFHQNSTFSCPICQLNLQGCSGFVDHLLLHNPADKTLINDSLLTNKRQTSRPTQSRSITNGSKAFKCSDCASSFSTKSNLTQHLSTHNHEAASAFNCSVCQKSFYSRSALKLHFRIHNNYCPFKCEFVGCSENFRTKKLMKTHIRREHFAITTTNKRKYSASDAQRVIRKLAELSGKKTINEEVPLKKSANSAFSSLPIRRAEPERQRPMGRASLDISQFPPMYYNANCIQMQTNNNIVMPRRVGSANFLFPNMYGYRN